MTGFESKRQAAQAKVQEEMQVIFTQRQAERDKLQDEPDMLLIVYQSGFADGKRSAERKPLTEEEIKQALTSVDPETKRLPPGMKAFARAIEAAHGIKEKT
jgi:CelD/BcsL family acetyltransferase involved in cellulose biosynthesis